MSGGGKPLAVNVDVVPTKDGPVFLEQGGVFSHTGMTRSSEREAYPNAKMLLAQGAERVAYFRLVSPASSAPLEYELPVSKEITCDPIVTSIRDALRIVDLPLVLFLDHFAPDLGRLPLHESTLAHHLYSSGFLGRIANPARRLITDCKLAFHELAKVHRLPTPETHVVRLPGAALPGHGGDGWSDVLASEADVLVCKPMRGSRSLGVVVLEKANLPALMAFWESEDESLLPKVLRAQKAELAQLKRRAQEAGGTFLIQRFIDAEKVDDFRPTARLFLNIDDEGAHFVDGYCKYTMAPDDGAVSRKSMISDSASNRRERAQLLSGKLDGSFGHSGSGRRIDPLTDSMNDKVSATLDQKNVREFMQHLRHLQNVDDILAFLEAHPVCQAYAPEYLLSGYFEESAYDYCKNLSPEHALEYLLLTLRELAILMSYGADMKKQVGAIQKTMLDLMFPVGTGGMVSMSKPQIFKMPSWRIEKLNTDITIIKSSMGEVGIFSVLGGLIKPLDTLEPPKMSTYFNQQGVRAFKSVDFVNAKHFFEFAARISKAQGALHDAASCFKNAAVCADRLGLGPEALSLIHQAVILHPEESKFQEKQAAFTAKYSSTPFAAAADAPLAGAGAGKGVAPD